MLHGARGRNSGVGTQDANCEAPERTSPSSWSIHASSVSKITPVTITVTGVIYSGNYKVSTEKQFGKDLRWISEERNLTK